MRLHSAIFQQINSIDMDKVTAVIIDSGVHIDKKRASYEPILGFSCENGKIRKDFED